MSLCQIPLSNKPGLFAIVSPEDFEWAMQWKWKAVKSKGAKVKWYAFRTTRFKGRHVGYYLHKEVCLRANGPPPSPDHHISDHQDGESLNDRRDNLEWSTVSQNRVNRNGLFAQQLRMAFKTGDMKRIVSCAS